LRAEEWNDQDGPDWATRVVFYCQKKWYLSGMAAGRSTRWTCRFRCFFFWPSAIFDRSLFFISFALQVTCILLVCAAQPMDGYDPKKAKVQRGGRGVQTGTTTLRMSYASLL
jgi:hypothetical protein